MEKKLENSYKIDSWDGKDSKEVFSAEQLFSNLRKSEWISDIFFEEQMNNFMQKNKEWYEIFENMFFVVKKKWVDSTKAILAFILLIDKIQELKWTKAEKALYVILKNKPALFWKLLKWFYDDVEKLKDIEKSKEVVEKSKEVVKKK